MLILLFFLCAQQPFQRGMWVRASCLAFPDSLPKIMRVAEDMNITDIYAQVVVSGYAYYRSRILPRSQYLARISGAKYDPLSALIREAKKRSMRVHAWVNCFVIWSLETPPDSARHVYYLHPEWFIKDLRGKSVRDYTYVEWRRWGLEGMFLDPGHPAVQNHLMTVCAEICRLYPVAGVHLDFIRYPGVLWGFADRSPPLALAGPETDTLRWLDLTRYPRLSFYLRWLAWRMWQETKPRETAVRKLVAEIKSTVQATARTRPCVLTAAVFPNPALARYSFSQNWPEWQEALDYPVVMSYTPDIGFFADMIHYTRNRRPDAVYGIGLIWPNMEDEAVWEIRRVQENHGAGICFFEYTTLDTLVDRQWIKSDQIKKPESLTIDTMRYTRLAQAFSDTAGRSGSRTIDRQALENQTQEFIDYLWSLSLEPQRDLARLGLTRDEFVQQVTADAAAFADLDCEWNAAAGPVQFLDDLVEPPSRVVDYEFLPWVADSDSTVIRRAAAVQNLPKSERIYPRSMDRFSRAVFSAPLDTRSSVETPAGIYVYQVRKTDPGGQTVSRSQIRADLLPLFEHWTIRQGLRRRLENK